MNEAIGFGSGYQCGFVPHAISRYILRKLLLSRFWLVAPSKQQKRACGQRQITETDLT